MKRLLNTLYIVSEDAYLSLDGENIKISYPDGKHNEVPLHLLESILSFSYKGASSALMGKCAEKGIYLSFFKPNGRYLASVANTTNGNVHLRREQYRIADNDSRSLRIAVNMICGKLYNSRWVIERTIRDHSLRVHTDALKKASDSIKAYMKDAYSASSVEQLRGIEGNSAAEYFGVFNEFILQNEDAFIFTERSRRPPLDRVNALLSFSYALLSNECAAALYGVGLDPYVGFLHTDRAGRKSLALDLMEELRSPFADRFIISLINNRIIGPDDIEISESGACELTEKGRNCFLEEWQKKKRQPITHPYLKEKISWGLVPHAQAMLLARHIRNDLDEYPPFFWK